MHFHLPKPLHGWREFAGEVGIIVIGVLIALGAEQVVEAFAWREKVAIVRQSLMGELSNDRARWEHDVAAAKCISDEVSGVRGWANGNVQRLPPMPVMKSSLLYSLHTTNWTLAANSQTLDHFPIRDQLAFASLYSAILGRQTQLLKVSDMLDQ